MCVCVCELRVCEADSVVGGSVHELLCVCVCVCVCVCER